MPRGTKRGASNPTAFGSRKKSKTASGAPILPLTTHASTRTQDGEAAKPLKRGDTSDLVQEVVTTLVTQGNNQVLVTNATSDCEESNTSWAQSAVMRQTPIITGMLSYFLLITLR